MLTRISLAVICLLSAHFAQAIVNISSATGQTTAPTGTGGEPTDPGFNNVGVVNSSSGVYLGNRWVLTANHVANQTSEFSITLGGVTYAYDGLNNYRIAGADLRLFRLSSDPGLPGLEISSSTPAAESFLVMAGRGRTRDASLTTWYINRNGNLTGDPEGASWVWSESVFPEADAIVQGYKTNTSNRAVRWGTNLLADTGSTSIGDYFTTTFSPDSDISQTDYEAQAVTNDSGGAVFYEGAGGWELAGIMASVALYKDQPSGAATAMFGQLTYNIDLSSYRDEILSVIAVPEPQQWAMIAGLLGLMAITRRRLRLS